MEMFGYVIFHSAQWKVLYLKDYSLESSVSGSVVDVDRDPSQWKVLYLKDYS